MAARFAKAFGSDPEAFWAGLLHDLGKYSIAFQRRLQNPAISGIKHWVDGANFAYGTQCYCAAWAVYGHHLGLPSPADFGQNLRVLKDPVLRPERTGYSESLADLLERFRADGLELPAAPVSHDKDRFAFAQRIRFLFSALVDADYLDTENHFNPELAEARNAPVLNAAQALGLLKTHLAGLPCKGPVGELRRQLLDDCLVRATCDPGLFSLSAPTGSGKTLASLAFALKHIAYHNATLPEDDARRFRRVIVVIPYTSIIEQTAAVYRRIFEDAFGPEFVLEHHSAVMHGDGNEDDGPALRARLACENWDAPLVVTTSVQFFESLFSNRPGACRKLHNIARSVVLFDEVQTLPEDKIPSLLSAVRLLTGEPYGSTAVFMTATQPSFDSIGEALPYGWQPREISSHPEAMAEAMRRTDIRIAPEEETVTWDELAARLGEKDQDLCVVNTTRDARTLFRLLPEEGRFHLSSRLCPAHRQEVLARIREQLHAGQPCRLVSTQLIEAGVDVDFPVAFRAMGPLDSIIQTAGRCNREGHSPTPLPVFVFRPKDGKLPPGFYTTAVARTSDFLKKNPGAPLHSPETYRKYFKELYKTLGPQSADNDPVFAASKSWDFPLAAQQCRLVGKETQAVLVKWGEGQELIAKLQREKHLSKADWRKVQRFSVNLYGGEFRKAQACHYIEEAIEGVWFWNSNYDEALGAYHAEGNDFLL